MSGKNERQTTRAGLRTDVAAVREVGEGTGSVLAAAEGAAFEEAGQEGQGARLDDETLRARPAGFGSDGHQREAPLVAVGGEVRERGGGVLGAATEETDSTRAAAGVGLAVLRARSSSKSERRRTTVDTLTSSR